MARYLSFGLSLLALVAIALVSARLLASAQHQASYLGLPATPCLDPTKPILQDFETTIIIKINGENIPLSPSIGQDPGDCLRIIHTEDASGAVRVEANDNDTYTLGEFFGVWHKAFSADELMGNFKDARYAIGVYKDGVKLDTFDETPLTPGARYLIEYGPVY